MILCFLSNCNLNAARGDFPARVMLHHTLMMEYNADLSPPEMPLNVTHDLTLRRIVKFVRLCYKSSFITILY